MPGYGGYIAGFNAGPVFTHFSGNFAKTIPKGNTPKKFSDFPYGQPDDLYAPLTDPRVKTNIKNRSDIRMGDDRDRFWGTTYEAETEPVDLAKLPTHQAEEMITGWNDLEPEQRLVQYDRALHFVTVEGRQEAELAVRDKINQRSSGGAFALRKAFKLFDRDGSGDIDPDEFKLAMTSFGCSFTDRQVLALFGSYDDDCSGALDYYEFLDKVLESDYQTEDGQAVTSCRPQTPPRRHYQEQHDLYRQMVRLKEMYSYCCKACANRITVDEARDFLEECGHKEPEEDCILQIVQATCPDTNGDLTFEQLWDWFVGTLDIPVLGTTPQYQVAPERSGMNVLRDTQGRKHQQLKKAAQSGAFDLDGDGEVSAEEFQAWRDKRKADVDNDGEVTQEELEAYQAEQKKKQANQAPRSPLWLGSKLDSSRGSTPRGGNRNPSGSQTSRPNTGGFHTSRVNGDGSGVKLKLPLTARSRPSTMGTKSWRFGASTGKFAGNTPLSPRLPPNFNRNSKSVRPNTCATGYRVCPETRFL